MTKNLFADIPGDLPDELFQELASGSSFTLKRIVSRGHTTDWYDQDQNEWVLLIQGGAKIEFQDRSTVKLGPGDYLLIPSHQKHRVAWTAPDRETLWLALYFDCTT
jgi:cupin 2 domain-containing protein